jgi:hypothetical protein
VVFGTGKRKKILFCFRKIRNPPYNEVCNIAKVLAETAACSLGGDTQLLVLTENDFAKQGAYFLNEEQSDIGGKAEK